MLVSIAEKNRQELLKGVYEAISNVNLKRNVEDYLAFLDPISCASDKIQASNVHLSDAVKIWTDLSSQLGNILDTKQMQAFAKRKSMALTPTHYFSFYLDPRFRSENVLTPLEIEEAMNLAQQLDQKLVGVILKFRVGKEPFMPTMFSDEALHAVSPADWWSLVSIDSNLKEHIQRILTCSTTTAELERLFSTFGFVHSSLRNRLGIEKCGKLVFCFRILNQ